MGYLKSPLKVYRSKYTLLTKEILKLVGLFWTVFLDPDLACFSPEITSGSEDHSFCALQRLKKH